MSDWSRYDSHGQTSRSDFDRDDDFRSFEDHGTMGRAREGMAQARDSARQMTDRARDGFDSWFHRHPLLMGAGALALGIAVGMLVPGTRQEERWMGDASSRMRERGMETAHKLGDVAKATFDEARHTAQEELEGSGLDPTHLKESAKETAHNLREAAEHTAQSASEKAKEEAERKNLR